MKFVVFGQGKMAKSIQELCKTSQEYDHLASLSKNDLKMQLQEKIPNTSFILDFAHAQGIFERVSLALRAKIPIIIGTTGWDKDYERIVNLVKKERAYALFCPNFSLGVLTFYQIAHQLATLIEKLDLDAEYLIKETHHTHKKDRPSGSAIYLKNLLETQDIHAKISSFRKGEVFGTHRLLIKLDKQELEFVHKSHDRKVFAEGALAAAKWLMDKFKRNEPGFYTSKDWFTSLSQ